ncbi:MAG: ATP-dependent helicase, partial [Syntrophaceae bacterium]
LLREGLPAAEIAVLYRAHYHSMELQMELTRRGIPFEIRSGIRFFEQAHIKDLIAYLRILVNPRDESAWKRVLGLYSRIGPKTASRIWKYVSSKQDPLAAVFADGFVTCGGKGAVESLKKLSDAFQQIVFGSQDLPVAKMIDRVLDNYREHLQAKYTEATSREEDIEQLKGFSAKFGSLEEFLSDLALLTNMADTNEDATENYLRDDRVVLSTIHQAKGLEWPVVFLIWCSEGMIPLARALKDEDGEEEERRLFYVACTRARDELYFCYPLVDYSRGLGGGYLSPSRFLEELTISDSRGRGACPYERWGVT